MVLNFYKLFYAKPSKNITREFRAKDQAELRAQ